MPTTGTPQAASSAARRAAGRVRLAGAGQDQRPLRALQYSQQFGAFSAASGIGTGMK
jgi:hypothetical protein